MSDYNDNAEQAARRLYDQSGYAAPTTVPPAPASTAETQEAIALRMFPSMAPASAAQNEGRSAATPPQGAPADKPPAPAVAPAAADPWAGLKHAPHAPDTIALNGDAQREITDAAERSGMTPEEAAAVGEQWSAVFSAHGVSESHVQHLVSAGLQAARGVPDAETAQAWRTEAHERINFDFGGTEGGARALEVARQYVAAHPALWHHLERTGLGNHPRVVAVIADVAHRARKEGKF